MFLLKTLSVFKRMFMFQHSKKVKKDILGNLFSVIDVEIQELNIYHSHVFFYGRAAFKKEGKVGKNTLC